MKQTPILSWLLAIGLAVFLMGCGDDEENGGGGAVGGIVGNAPATVNGAEYDITEPSGTSTISFTIAGRNYTLSRIGMASESGSFVANPVGNDTWDVTLNNALDGSASRLVLTFTSATSGNFSFTPPNGATINGQFRRSGFGSTTTGSTTTGSTTTGSTTTGTTTTGGTAIDAPATINQIVFNGRAGNPSGAGQTVVNISGSAFSYSGNGASGNGTVTYSANGSSAQMLLNYNGSNDFDDYTLQFLAPSGSPNLSAYSGTQRVGLTTGPASGTFTYTQ